MLQIALNARDAMLKGGKLLFRTKNLFLDENNAWLRFGGKPGNYIQISISDTGIGMNGQVKQKIFKPYFTTKGDKEGKGLGLSMVQEIVENHGGFITVFSEKDKGTVFKIHFPAIQKMIQEKRIDQKEKPTLGKETILLVDNEKVLRETARKMLTRYGYKVISAENGTEAVSIYKKYMDRIDLIIMELMLPGIEVTKVIDWLKKLNPNVKIIASQGVGSNDSISKKFDQTIAGYVQKPFQVRPLLQKVRTILNA
jgi:CheY-like chemotaxis protein